MKKTLSLILALSLSSTVFADQEMPPENYAEPIDIRGLKHASVSDDDRMQMITSFFLASMSGLALKKGQAKFGISTAVHGALQVSNGLWHMGSIAKNEVLHDLSVRTLLASGATALTGLPQVSTLVAATPFIGEGLKAGAQYTTGLLTVSAYKMAERGMGRFCNTFADWNLSICATF